VIITNDAIPLSNDGNRHNTGWDSCSGLVTGTREIGERIVAESAVQDAVINTMRGRTHSPPPHPFASANAAGVNSMGLRLRASFDLVQQPVKSIAADLPCMSDGDRQSCCPLAH
jgi:hypothetical protein